MLLDFIHNVLPLLVALAVIIVSAYIFFEIVADGRKITVSPHHTHTEWDR